MTNVIHQIPDISAMYKEIYRVLKPNGVLCICTENRRQLLSKYWIKYFPSIVIKDLKRFPSIGKLIRLAKQQHFSTIKTTFIGETKWSHVTKFIYYRYWNVLCLYLILFLILNIKTEQRK